MVTFRQRSQLFTNKGNFSLLLTLKSLIFDMNVCMCPPQTRTTGTGPSERLRGRPRPPPEEPRRPTGSTRTDSTEADWPPLACRPDQRLSTTAALALSSPTKVIVRFVFVLFIIFSPPDSGLYTKEQIGTENWTCFFFLLLLLSFLPFLPPLLN